NLHPEEDLILLKPRPGEEYLLNEDVLEVIDRQGDEIALILLPGIQYYTGQLFDISAIAEIAKKKNCKVGFDLAHAVGNVELSLHDAGVDFAVWCSYKYLNAGPGAVGGCFVHERHLKNEKLSRFEGWWGHDKKTRFQ